jgi:hypothetical protein
MQEFLKKLAMADTDESLLDFCRMTSLHGTPFVFSGREDDYYNFRKRIAKNFNINFHEILITGSAKLGFSLRKNKNFDYDSDIDVALISPELYDEIMRYIHSFQMELRENRRAVTEYDIKKYHKFLEYGALGWMRPDLLPTSSRIKEIRQKWFDFFDSISYGKSEVGDYKVTAGAFKTYSHLEKYTLSGLRSIRSKIQMES